MKNLRAGRVAVGGRGVSERWLNSTGWEFERVLARTDGPGESKQEAYSGRGRPLGKAREANTGATAKQRQQRQRDADTGSVSFLRAGDELTREFDRLEREGLSEVVEGGLSSFSAYAEQYSSSPAMGLYGKMTNTPV